MNLRTTAFPLIIGFHLAMTFSILWATRNFFIANIISPLPTTILARGLERLIPLHQNQEPFGREEINSLLHYSLGWVAKFTIFFFTYDWFASIFDPTPFPLQWPYFLQVLVYLLMFDLLYYVSHFLFHKVPFLWRFHIIHHRPQQLNSFRTHSVHCGETLVTYTLTSFIVVALINPPEIVAIWSMPMILGFVIAQHSNIDFNLGVFEKLFIGSETHRVHHLKSENKVYNYGVYFTLFDRLFGTYKSGHKLRHSTDYGVNSSTSPFFINQILSPLRSPEEFSPDDKRSSPKQEVGYEK